MLRALNQAARELLLAQSSDWAYFMSHGPLVNDAVKRVRTHLARFVRLAHDLDARPAGRSVARRASRRATIRFPALDYRLFR